MRHTRYSNVSGISRIDLTPAQTTATGVLPSSIKSALTSKAERKFHLIQFFSKIIWTIDIVFWHFKKLVFS